VYSTGAAVSTNCPFFLFTFVRSVRHRIILRCHNTKRRARKTDGEGIIRSCLANICTINREKCHSQGIACNCTAELEERLVLHWERARDWTTDWVRRVVFAGQDGPHTRESIVSVQARIAQQRTRGSSIRLVETCLRTCRRINVD